MLIDRVFPEVIQRKEDFKSCILAEAKKPASNENLVLKILNDLPMNLTATGRE